MFAPFISFVSILILAAAAPTKVSGLERSQANGSVAKPPKVIYVKTFTVSKAGRRGGSGDIGGPRLLGALRGGEENTVIERHRAAQEEDTLAKVPSVLQRALIEDL